MKDWSIIWISGYVFTQPLHHEHNVTQGHFLNSIPILFYIFFEVEYSWFEFSFPYWLVCLSKAEASSLPYCLPIVGAGERTNGLMLFSREFCPGFGLWSLIPFPTTISCYIKHTSTPEFLWSTSTGFINHFYILVKMNKLC